jgi:hypothetical protein
VRYFLGFLVAALALGAAVWLHNAELQAKVCRGIVPGDANGVIDCKEREPFRIRTIEPARKADWQDPLAVVIAVAGIGAGVGIIASGTRRHATREAT